MLYSDDKWDLKLIFSFGEGSMEKAVAAQSTGLKQVTSNRLGPATAYVGCVPYSCPPPRDHMRSLQHSTYGKG